MIPINTSPDSFNSIIQNLRTVLIDPLSDFGSNLEVIERSERRSFASFTELVNKTEELFFNLLEKGSLSKKENEYVPGRISVSLERIAQSQYRHSIEETHQIMKSFSEKILVALKQDLPPNTVFLKPDVAFTKNNKEIFPFYQETQQTILSCQLHAFNAAVGYPIVALSSPEFLSLNTDLEGIACKIIHQATKKNALFIPIDDFIENKLYENYPAFMASDGPHAFTYRKDQNGQWWKVDSLYKVSESTYQTSVDLLEEKEKWTQIRVVTDSTPQLLTRLEHELTELSHRIAEIQKKHLSNTEISDVRALTDDITNKCFTFIRSASFCHLEEFHTDHPLIDDSLALLQGCTRPESKLVELISDINMSIRKKIIDVGQFNAKLDAARTMIANALSSLQKKAQK
jgi:hypothetical protein